MPARGSRRIYGVAGTAATRTGVSRYIPLTLRGAGRRPCRLADVDQGPRRRKAPTEASTEVRTAGRPIRGQDSRRRRGNALFAASEAQHA